ncbi:MAG TPA: ribose-phosphate pyrophosphokinase [Clostridia bacterium]|nr:ribose-phosphate pyrophosphokinase [Clostridia bacterium]
MSDNHYRLKVFSANANRELAMEIADYLGVTIGDATIDRFSDGEIQVKIEESVRGVDVYVVQPTCPPVNENLMELLIMVDAFARASARKITAVIPYYGYARQDRKARARDPITAKLIANILVAAGAKRVLAMDLHAPQIQGFFDIPVDHLPAAPILAKYFLEKGYPASDWVVVSPDVGGVARARQFAGYLNNASIAIIDKRRPKPNVAEVMNIVGSVKGKRAILIDDIIDTAGTITNGARAVMEQGAKEVYACCTHPLFSGPAKERLLNSPLKEIVVTNTIPVKKEDYGDRLKVLSVAPMLGEAINRIHYDLSVSKLFD